MVRAIAGPVKRAILQVLQSRGYVLVRQKDYASMAARLSVVGAETASAESASRASPLPPGFAADTAQATEIEGFLKRAQEVIGSSPPPRAAAIFIAARHLVKNRVPGDVVDCSDGATTNLALLATALSTLGDTSRHLIMFDVSGDATHRPDFELPLWGIDTSDLSDGRSAEFARRIAPATPLSKELVATGYPRENMRVAHYPVDAIDLSRPIAYLGLIADSYDSNRAAIRALFPRVSSNGIIAVEGAGELRPSQAGCVQHQIDAVERYLAEYGRKLAFWRATARFRAAINQTARDEAASYSVETLP